MTSNSSLCIIWRWGHIFKFPKGKYYISFILRVQQGIWTQVHVCDLHICTQSTLGQICVNLCVCLSAHVWEVNIKCLLCFFSSLFFKTESLLNLKFTDWPQSLFRKPEILLYLSSIITRLKSCATMPIFYVVVGNVKSNSYRTNSQAPANIFFSNINWVWSRQTSNNSWYSHNNYHWETMMQKYKYSFLYRVTWRVNIRWKLLSSAVIYCDIRDKHKVSQSQINCFILVSFWR